MPSQDRTWKRGITHTTFFEFWEKVQVRTDLSNYFKLLVFLGFDTKKNRPGDDGSVPRDDRLICDGKIQCRPAIPFRRA